jgi:hypothetical protein
MQCYVCGKESGSGYLCKEHAELLLYKLKLQQTIQSPTFAYHCAICGEWKDRIIVEDENGMYFCDRDIFDECKRYGIK